MAAYRELLDRTGTLAQLITAARSVFEADLDAGHVTVDRVVCAVDCGIPINPDVIAAQMEGGIGFGLGAVLYGAITLKDGRVEQDNFNGYRVLRINEMPKVEVHIVPSAEAPTGVGEPATLLQVPEDHRQVSP